MLEGETKRLMVANAEHSMATGVIPLITGLDAFWQSIISNTPRPEISWTMAPDSGVIDFYTNVKPNKVVMRFSQTLDGKRRDFRLVRGDTPADPCEPQGIPVKIFGDGESTLSPRLEPAPPAEPAALQPHPAPQRQSLLLLLRNPTRSLPRAHHLARRGHWPRRPRREGLPLPGCHAHPGRRMARLPRRGLLAGTQRLDLPVHLAGLHRPPDAAVPQLHRLRLCAPLSPCALPTACPRKGPAGTPASTLRGARRESNEALRGLLVLPLSDARLLRRMALGHRHSAPACSFTPEHLLHSRNVRLCFEQNGALGDLACSSSAHGQRAREHAHNPATNKSAAGRPGMSADSGHLNPRVPLRRRPS